MTEQHIDLTRRVKNQSGVEYFGQPIGSIITPDNEDDAKAKHGRRAPAGSYTGSNQKRAGTKDGSSTGTEPQNADSASTNEVISFSSKGFKKPTISGPVPVLAGKAKFGAPEGSSVYKSPKHQGRVYVVTPDGMTHVITSNGELNLTPAESQALTAQVTSRFNEVVEGEQEEDTKEVTWVRLQSLMRQIEQAQDVGDTSQVEKLMQQFKEAANSYDPDSDPRELRTKIKKATGVK